MTIIDSQVHAYEANTAKRPWHTVPNWPDHVTGDEMVAAMDKVGASTARSSSPPLPCTATTPAMRWKFNELTPTGSPGNYRSLEGARVVASFCARAEGEDL
jgi:hypothetical protein